MGFMNAIKSLFSPAGDSSRRTYVVDGARLVDEKTGRRMAPREQLQMLNALARVSKQENFGIQVVFESDRALREVEDGGEFNGIGVHFAPDTEQLVAKALKLCRGGDTLVSSGVTMESRATEAGITVVSSSTFRKVFLAGGLPGGGGGSNRGDRSDRRRGRDRRRDRDNRPNRGDRNGNRSSQKASRNGDGDSAPTGSDQASDGDDDQRAVRNLIDLVD